MNLNKGISTPIAILIIVVVAALAGGVFYWQYQTVGEEEVEAPTKGKKEKEEKLADWEEYIHEECKYRIKYPSDYFVFSSEEDGVVIREEGEENYKEFNLACIELETQEGSFDEALEIAREGLAEQGEFKEEEIEVAGNRGIRMTLKDWVPCPSEIQECRNTTVVWKVGEEKYTLYALFGTLYGKGDFDELLKTSDKILSTFKVIDPQKLDWKDYWKTYSSKNYGFRIKYPQEYSVKENKDTNSIRFGVPETSRFPFDVSIFNNPNNYSLKKFYNFYGDSRNEEIAKEEAGRAVYDYFSNEPARSRESVKVDKVSGVKFLPGNGSYVIICLPYKNKVFEIHYQVGVAINSERMLSTFKFTE